MSRTHPSGNAKRLQAIRREWRRIERGHVRKLDLRRLAEMLREVYKKDGDYD